MFFCPWPHDVNAAISHAAISLWSLSPLQLCFFVSFEDGCETFLLRFFVSFNVRPSWCMGGSMPRVRRRVTAVLHVRVCVRP